MSLSIESVVFCEIFPIESDRFPGDIAASPQQCQKLEENEIAKKIDESLKKSQESESRVNLTLQKVEESVKDRPPLCLPPLLPLVTPTPIPKVAPMRPLTPVSQIEPLVISLPTDDISKLVSPQGMISPHFILPAPPPNLLHGDDLQIMDVKSFFMALFTIMIRNVFHCVLKIKSVFA